MSNHYLTVLFSSLAFTGCLVTPVGPPIDSSPMDTGDIPTTPSTTTETTTTETTTGTSTEWDGTWSGTLEVRMDDFNGGQDSCQADLTLVVDSTAIPQISGQANCEFSTELRGVVDMDFEGDLLFLGGTYILDYDLLNDFSPWDGVFVDDMTFRGTFGGNNYGYSDAYIFTWTGDWELTRQ
jgi:hypothetical protein